MIREDRGKTRKRNRRKGVRWREEGETTEQMGDGMLKEGEEKLKKEWRGWGTVAIAEKMN